MRGRDRQFGRNSSFFFFLQTACVRFLWSFVSSTDVAPIVSTECAQLRGVCCAAASALAPEGEELLRWPRSGDFVPLPLPARLSGKTLGIRERTNFRNWEKVEIHPLQDGSERQDAIIALSFVFSRPGVFLGNNCKHVGVNEGSKALVAT